MYSYEFEVDNCIMCGVFIFLYLEVYEGVMCFVFFE